MLLVKLKKISNLVAFKLIEMEKLSYYDEGDWFNHQKLKIRNSKYYVIWTT